VEVDEVLVDDVGVEVDDVVECVVDVEELMLVEVECVVEVDELVLVGVVVEVDVVPG